MKKLIQSLLSLIIISCLLSCGKSVQDIIKLTEESIFIIYTFDEFGVPHGSGSGFFIDSKGTGITNYHVLDGAAKAFLKTSAGEEFEINTILGSDSNWDIVKFSIKGSHNHLKYLSFSKSGVKKGNEIYNIGSPLGLESTISSGIVSSLREDSKYGNIVQITAPISPGSSGSPLLDKNGKVFAVATFLKQGGQNLNFGVVVNQESIEKLTSTEFLKTNQKFNSNSNLYILNRPSDKGAEIILNAIEFGETVTTVYLTYTHLNLMGDKSYYIWVELGEKDESFTIEDSDSRKKYYVTSSTLGVDKNNATNVELVTTTRFKVYLPPIRDKLERFSIYGCGLNDGRWVFKDIDLSNHHESIMSNFDYYLHDYAFTHLNEGQIEEARDMLLDLIYENPSDVIALNALGIISYLADNNNDALYYFTEAINSNPNQDLSYINRHVVYNYQGNNTAALEDINKAISIEPDQPDNFLYRADIYVQMENWVEAKKDIDKVLSSLDFNKDVNAYLFRIYINSYLNDQASICQDIQTAYNLTNDAETISYLEELWRDYDCR